MTLPDRELPQQVDARFLEHVIEVSPIVMFRQRLADGVIEYASKNSEAIIGVPASEVVGSRSFFPGRMEDPDRSRFEHGIAAVVNGTVDIWESEYQLLTGSGERRWFVIAIRIDRGSGDAILGYAADVTARVLSEREAREAVARYQAMFEGIPSGIFRSSPDGRLLEANPKLADIFGYESAEEFKRSAPDVASLYVDRRDRARFMQSVVAQGSVQNFDVRMHRRDGEIIDVSMNASLVRDPDGNPIAFEGTLFDVSDQRRAEEEARAARAEADRANQAKSAFLSRISHELRTPLNSILGFAQLLEMRGLEPGASDAVAYILKGGRHLLELINEVLDIARVETGRLGMSLESVEIAETVMETIDLIRPLAAAREIEVVFDNRYCDGHVLADRQRLKQVLLNLLSNAVKYNRARGRVLVGCYREDGHLVLTVADTGVGMSPGQLERLFTPFDRLGAEVGEEEGTGLGLVLSRHVVEAMGGRLTVASEAGRGSAFSVSLASVAAPVVEVPKPSAGEPLATSVEMPVGGRVLYVEDNLANMSLVEQIFSLRPHLKLEGAMQGRLGVMLAQTHLPDLIVLDLNLSDMGGREVLRELRLDERTVAIPVLVVSADASPAQIQRLLDDGAAGYLTKPLDVIQFLAEVDRLLTG